MLASLGSIASQSSIFKGVLWDFGNNIFNLPLTVTGGTLTQSGGFFYTTATESGAEARLNCSSLGIKASSIRLTTRGMRVDGTASIIIRYTDGTSVFRTIPSGNGSYTQSTANYAIDPTKTIAFVCTYNYEAYDDYGWMVSDSQIGYIEII